MERIQPLGVFLVGLLTVITALGTWFFAFIFILPAAAYPGGISESPFPNVNTAIVLTGLTVAFGTLLLADAVLIFRGMRTGYFLSMASWIVLIITDIWLGYGFGLFIGYFIPITAFLILYPFFSFAYFSTQKVKTYFSI